MAGSSSIGGGGPPGDISFNYVPLIDVTFNLIIFFVLTSEIGSAQKARVLIPDPYEPQAVRRDAMSHNSVVIAVISAAAYESNADPVTAARALKYEMDGQGFEISDLDKLVGMIAKKRETYDKIMGAVASKGEFYVEIRADWRVHFSEIRPIIEAIARAKIPKMAISAKKAA
jgi:biopolymer transport protein ExbD